MIQPGITWKESLNEEMFHVSKAPGLACVCVVVVVVSVCVCLRDCLITY